MHLRLQFLPSLHLNSWLDPNAITAGSTPITVANSSTTLSLPLQPNFATHYHPHHCQNPSLTVFAIAKAIFVAAMGRVFFFHKCTTSCNLAT